MGEIINSVLLLCLSAPPMLADDGWGTLRGSDWREQVHQQVWTELLCGDFSTLNCILYFIKILPENFRVIQCNIPGRRNNALWGKQGIWFFHVCCWEIAAASAFIIAVYCVCSDVPHFSLLINTKLLCLSCFGSRETIYVDIAKGSETGISLSLISKGILISDYLWS